MAVSQMFSWDIHCVHSHGEWQLSHKEGCQGR